MKYLAIALVAIGIAACGGSEPESACENLIECGTSAYSDQAACEAAIETDSTTETVDCLAEAGGITKCLEVIACGFQAAATATTE